MRQISIIFACLCFLGWAENREVSAAPLNPGDFNDFDIWDRRPNGDMILDESAIEDGRLNADAIRQLAEDGNITAQRVLGIRLTFSEGSSKFDREKGVEWLQKGAAAGDVPAQEHLSEALIKGVGTPVDQRAGLKWLKAASGGSVEALFRAGDLQIRGSSDVRDENAGFLAVREAARKKHPKALERLAQCYRLGIGTEPSTFLFLLTARKARKANPETAPHGFIADVVFWGAILLGSTLLILFTKIITRRL